MIIAQNQRVYSKMEIFPFTPHPDFLPEIEALEECGYVERFDPDIVWTLKIAPFMEAAGFWSVDDWFCWSLQYELPIRLVLAIQGKERRISRLLRARR